MVHLADQLLDQLEDNLTNIKYMNQNQIDRLYKVAISRNAYANKIAEDNQETPGPGEEWPMPLSEMDTRNPNVIFPTTNYGKRELAYKADEGSMRKNFAAANSTTGFNFETFKKILQNPNVQMGAGLGAAGLAGYGIYKHLNKKKKRDEAYA